MEQTHVIRRATLRELRAFWLTAGTVLDDIPEIACEAALMLHTLEALDD